MTAHSCRKCGGDGPFRTYLTGSGKHYEMRMCRSCENEERSARQTERWATDEVFRRQEAERQRRRHAYSVVFDPTGFYVPGATFESRDFRCSLLGGVWPDKMVVYRPDVGWPQRVVGTKLQDMRG